MTRRMAGDGGAGRWRQADVLPWFCLGALGLLPVLGCCSWLLTGSVTAADADILILVRRLAAGPGVIRATAKAVMLAATALGSFAALLLLVLGAAALLARAGRRGEAMRLIVQTGVGVALANGLKLVFGRPRPHVVAHWATVTSSSFPSGHSAASAITFFLLAGVAAGRLAPRPAARLRGLAAGMVVLVGLSRVYLGVHWPSDVLAGWAFGGGWAWWCRRRWSGEGGPAFLRAATFRDVVVYPTQQLATPPFALFQGGPDWPFFWARRHGRHTRFTPAVPLDVRPRRVGPVVRSEAAGMWCGPVSPHFGHAVTHFGARLAASAATAGDRPLVFSARPDEVPPPFFWAMLRHLGVSPAQVRIVTAPTRFGELSVLPQAERLYGGGPSAAYLDLLDRLGGSVAAGDGGRVDVSRAGLWKGKIGGELYLEAALHRCGYRAFRPETVGLEEQLATYRRASHLVFAEGSALHGLQLLGRIAADVVVIARRRGSRLAEAALAPRVSSLAYVDAVRGMVRGVGRSGLAQPSAGITIVDQDRLVAMLEQRGIAVAAGWDRTLFLAQQAHDLHIWLDARAAHPPHRSDPRRIARSLRRLDLGPDPGRSDRDAGRSAAPPD